MVDANVGASAGQKPAGQSAACREALQAMLKSSAVMVLCPKLQREWRGVVGSNFARAWYGQMVSSGRVRTLRKDPPDQLSPRAGGCGLTTTQSAALLNDEHLLNAAIAAAAGAHVLSQDENTRVPATLVGKVHQVIGDICWANSSKPEEGVVAWLGAGAPHEDARRLRPQ